MAIPNNYIDKITNKDTGESRIISPAADKVRVENENFEGSDLNEVLDEVAQAIEDAGSGDGTVTGVKMNNGQPIAPDENGVVDLGTVITDVSNKVDKVTGYGLSKNDYTDADKTKLAGIETGAEKNVINGIKANGASETLPVENGIVTLPPASAGGLTEEDISVSSNQDGTFDINVGSDTYRINLNHTHPNMAKLVKCTEATLPQTMADDTIYVQVNNLTTPTEIEALHIFGLEFTGGGAAPGTPRLTSPSPSQISNGINIGNTTSGVATYSLNITAKDLTQSLLVEWGSGSTGYSFNTSNLPTGVTYDSGTGKLTITKEAACGINGVNIPVVYTGNDTDENAEGAIGISSSSVDGINVVVTLIVNKVTYEDLAGVKLTGTQWLQTDYHTNADTEFTLECKFTPNSRTDNANGDGTCILRCIWDSSVESGRYTLHMASGGSSFAYQAYSLYFMNKVGNENQKELNMRSYPSELVADHAVISYTKGASSGTFTFNGGTARSVTTALQTERQLSPLLIGYKPTEQKIFNVFDLTIYEFKITEGGTVVRDWVPKKRDGVTGLLDIATNGTGTFLSSETAKTSSLASDELVAIPLT